MTLIIHKLPRKLNKPKVRPMNQKRLLRVQGKTRRNRRYLEEASLWDERKKLKGKILSKAVLLMKKNTLRVKQQRTTPRKSHPQLKRKEAMNQLKMKEPATKKREVALQTKRRMTKKQQMQKKKRNARRNSHPKKLLKPQINQLLKKPQPKKLLGLRKELLLP